MKYGIVVNAYIRNNSQITKANRLAEELENLGAECEIIKNVNLAEIASGMALSVKYDGVIFLDKDKAAARLLEKNGIKLSNSAKAIEVCDDKMLTHIELANSGIPMPDCIYAPLCYYEDAEISDGFLNGVIEKLGLPLVAKKCFGSLGAGVTLIKSLEELKHYENGNKLCAHFYQKFIGKGGEDIRVIVIGGEYVCAMKRKNANDFRSNIELGGKGERFDADENLIALCEKVANLLGLDYCGIDVLTDEKDRKSVV